MNLLLEEVRSNLRILLSEVDGIFIDKMCAQYQRMMHRPLPFITLGYDSVEAFVQSIPDVARLDYSVKDRKVKVVGVGPSLIYQVGNADHSNQNALRLPPGKERHVKVRPLEVGRRVNSDGNRVVGVASISPQQDAFPDDRGIYTVCFPACQKPTELAGTLADMFSLAGKVENIHETQKWIYVMYHDKQSVQYAFKLFSHLGLKHAPDTSFQNDRDRLKRTVEKRKMDSSVQGTNFSYSMPRKRLRDSRFGSTTRQETYKVSLRNLNPAFKYTFHMFRELFQGYKLLWVSLASTIHRPGREPELVGYVRVRNKTEAVRLIEEFNGKMWCGRPLDLRIKERIQPSMYEGLPVGANRTSPVDQHGMRANLTTDYSSEDLSDLEDLPMLGSDRGAQGLESNVPGLESSMPRFERAMPGLERAMPGLERAMPGLERAMPGLERAMPGLERAMPGLERAMPGLERAMPGLERAMPGLERAMPGLERAMPELDRPMPGLERVMPGLERSMPGLERAMPGLERAMPGLEWAMPGLERAMPGLERAMPGLERAMPDLEGDMPGLERAMPGKPERERVVTGLERVIPGSKWQMSVSKQRAVAGFEQDMPSLEYAAPSLQHRSPDAKSAMSTSEHGDQSEAESQHSAPMLHFRIHRNFDAVHPPCEKAIVLVTNFHESLDEASFLSLFKDYQVKEVRLAPTFNGRRKAFIELGSVADVKAALKTLNNQVHLGRSLKVDIPFNKPDLREAVFGKGLLPFPVNNEPITVSETLKLRGNLLQILHCPDSPFQLGQVLDVLITTVISDKFFWGQIVDPEKMVELKNVSDRLEHPKPEAATGPGRCQAQYQNDGKWYRAWVMPSTDPRSSECRVFYVDYGNIAQIPWSQTALLPDRWVWELPPLAVPFTLTESVTNLQERELSHMMVEVNAVGNLEEGNMVVAKPVSLVPDLRPQSPMSIKPSSCR